MLDLQQGRPYLITYETRELGYGVEGGFEEYAIYNDRELGGKLAFTLANGEPIYLFDDEIKAIEADPPKPDMVTELRVRFLLEGAVDTRAANKKLDYWLQDAGENDASLISYEIVTQALLITSKKA